MKTEENIKKLFSKLEDKIENIQHKVVNPLYLEHHATTTLIDTTTMINILEFIDKETDIIYKMLRFLREQDEIKEYITKYQMGNYEYITVIKSNIKYLITLIESMKIEEFDKYIEIFEKFEFNKDIIKLSNNLQNIHTDIINILQNYGIKEKQETNTDGYDESKIIIYDIKYVTLLIDYNNIPEHIKDFIENFNELAEHKGSKAVIFYDNTSKIYRIDIYLGAAAGHRAIIKVHENIFELIYTDACYSRLLAVQKMCNDYHGKSGEFDIEIKELQPNLGNVSWKQSVLYFKSPNEFLSEMADLIKVINWDFVVNPNNKEMISSVENEAETIYRGAFNTNVKCHKDIIHIMSEYIRGLRNY